jgi:hypothetical protein
MHELVDGDWLAVLLRVFFGDEVADRKNIGARVGLNRKRESVAPLTRWGNSHDRHYHLWSVGAVLESHRMDGRQAYSNSRLTSPCCHSIAWSRLEGYQRSSLGDICRALCPDKSCESGQAYGTEPTFHTNHTSLDT